MNDKLIVGIDIGKRTHVATIIDQQATLLTRPISFLNTTEGAEFFAYQNYVGQSGKSPCCLWS